MYARIQTSAVRDHQSSKGDSQRFVDALARQPGCVDVYALRSAAGHSVVALWAIEEHARLGAAGSAIDLVYEVRDDLAGISRDSTPTAASMSYFSGPMSETTIAIGRRARHDRIAPVVLAVPGHVRLIALLHPVTQETCELTLLTSAAVGDAVRRAADSVALPPEERWVRQPDRVEDSTVTAVAAGREPATTPADRAAQLLGYLH